MPLGREIGLGPGHIVLDRDPAPPPKGHSPQFSAHVYCDKRSPISATAEHLSDDAECCLLCKSNLSHNMATGLRQFRVHYGSVVPKTFGWVKAARGTGSNKAVQVRNYTASIKFDFRSFYNAPH